MSCHFCKGSEKNFDRIKFAPAAAFLFTPVRVKYSIDRETLKWMRDLKKEKKFVVSVRGHYAQFDYCPGCGEKFDYMKWIRQLWNEFGDVPMDPKTEEIEERWLCFGEGTHREDIWHWFEETFDVSVAEDLMYCCMEGLE